MLGRPDPRMNQLDTRNGTECPGAAAGTGVRCPVRWGEIRDPTNPSQATSGVEETLEQTWQGHRRSGDGAGELTLARRGGAAVPRSVAPRWE
ncbi:hypothetical protein NDU88_007284 [Pleurodeles waltl]|uniref:Uncharacterized protein n=1 Tax=Pleurodeles waltl TaxID=8319 RepID=A0AAV7UPF8_PLEWA|nr:hypothetical protein NDU88_007284 [Pleurodeles waltl]